MENKNTQANEKNNEHASSSLERNELHNTIWKVANELRGSVDGWDFKQYVLGILFYRYISENMTHYINKEERKRDPGFDYALLSDEEAERAREHLIEEKGFFIPPSALFCNALKNAPHNEDLNVTLQNIFNEIEKSSLGTPSEENVKGLFADLDVNSNKLGSSHKEEINDDLIFEIELIKQVEVNIDYILNLIEEFAKEHDLEIQGVKTKIEPIINSSIELRNKKDLIMDFIDKYNKDQEVHAYFQDYIHQKREEEFQNIIEENRLNEEKAYSFMQHAFKGGEISFSGTEFPKIIEEKPSRFDKSSRYQEVKEKVAASLSRFFHRFCDLTSSIFKKNEIKKDEVKKDGVDEK
ncbi:type I restriction-modification system subunit M [Helicobacter pylori]|uniref:type I restriction-modification system subunit M n=1 Tax=Helicobacter pylori TaxID=210 RepID=UPI0013F4ABC8|nr:type I restriction-modification system subunit M [Helicobacter pylori]NHA61966.1 type I restriction-modification system subunit M [Helicobacter pylori]